MPSKKEFTVFLRTVVRDVGDWKKWLDANLLNQKWLDELTTEESIRLAEFAESEFGNMISRLREHISHQRLNRMPTELIEKLKEQTNETKPKS